MKTCHQQERINFSSRYASICGRKSDPCQANARRPTNPQDEHNDSCAVGVAQLAIVCWYTLHAFPKELIMFAWTFPLPTRDRLPSPQLARHAGYVSDDNAAAARYHHVLKGSSPFKEVSPKSLRGSALQRGKVDVLCAREGRKRMPWKLGDLPGLNLSNSWRKLSGGTIPQPA